MTSIKKIKQKEELLAVTQARVETCTQLSYWALVIATSSMIVSIMSHFL